MKKLFGIIIALCLTLAAVTGCAKKADGSKPGKMQVYLVLFKRSGADEK